MPSVGTPNAGNDNEKISDGLAPSLPHVDNASPLVQNKLYPQAVDCEESTGSQLKTP